jgi:hypothetical protein
MLRHAVTPDLTIDLTLDTILDLIPDLTLDITDKIRHSTYPHFFKGQDHSFDSALFCLFAPTSHISAGSSFNRER